LFVAASAGLEVWGVLGVALLAARRSGARAVGVALAATAALFAPFLVFGTFRMFQYHWAIAEGTPLSLFVSVGHPFSWTLRLLQGAAAALVGLGVARRAGAHAAWAAPLLLVATRIALDPIWNPWYMISLQTLGIVGGAAFLASERAALLRRAELASGTSV
jgi:hypothetical protein